MAPTKRIRNKRECGDCVRYAWQERTTCQRNEKSLVSQIYQKEENVLEKHAVCATDKSNHSAAL